MALFLVNTNTEIIRDLLNGADLFEDREIISTAASLGIGAATDVLEDADADFEYVKSYQSWRGGRAYRLGGTPLIAVDGNKQDNDLAWKAHGAFIFEADRYIKSMLKRYGIAVGVH